MCYKYYIWHLNYRLILSFLIGTPDEHKSTKGFSGKGMYLHTVMMTLNQILIYDVCRFLGTGLVTVTHYNDWSPKRRLYDPAFTKRSE